MDGEAVALAIAHACMSCPATTMRPDDRRVGAGDHLEQRGLAGAVRPHDADDLRLGERMVDVELEGRRAVEKAAAISL